MHWYTFTPEDCRTRIRWIENKKKKDKSENKDNDEPPNANLGNVDQNEGEEEKDDTNDTSPDVTAMLANALNMIQGNDVLRDMIADALANSTSE